MLFMLWRTYESKALKVLEYDKIIHLLADQATSDAGKKRCLELKPMTDKQDIIQAQTQTSDALPASTAKAI